MSTTLILLFVIAILACVLAAQARVYFKREERWRQREEQLRDQLWVLAGGKKPVVRFEHEKVVKVADPDAPPPPMTAWDLALFNEDVKETLEQVHPEAKSMSVRQAQARWPDDWKTIEAQIREEYRPIRA